MLVIPVKNVLYAKKHTHTIFFSSVLKKELVISEYKDEHQ